MKTITKIEIAILILVVLVAAGMVMMSEGVLNLFFEPEIRERTPLPIPTEAVMPLSEEETLPVETAPQETEAEETTPPETEPQTEEEPQDGESTDTQTEAEPRVITAERYFAYDVREDAYLTKLGDADEKLYPASITKLLTVHVLLQHMEPEDTVVIGDALTLVHEDSSVAGLMEGDTLTVEQLICAMMLPSGNDAAQAAAVAAGRKIAGENSLAAADAVQVFVDEMNAEAEALGMMNSHFENPDGWHHENHYTTMNDLVILSKKVLANPIILKYASLAENSVQMEDRTLEWKNTNYLLHSQGEAYVPNTIGLKTGYTDAAGGCLISAFFEDDRLWIIGVFGCPAHTMDRYLDTVDIYNSL